jgi:AraC-like DNA-binding protein
MEPQHSLGASLHFSTRSLAPAKRLGALRELFERSVCMEIQAPPGRPVDMEIRQFPGMRRACMVSPLTANATRPAQRLADGDDTICMIIKTGGEMSLAQRSGINIPGEGDAVLLVYRQPAVLQFEGTTYLSVRVPFAALAPMADLDAAAGRCIRRDTQALGLLRGYLASLPERFASMELCRLAATHVYDLMALSIGATRDAQEIASQRGVRAARYEAICADIERDPGVSIAELAARQEITPRYVQLLFEERGTTYSEFVLERRLDSARRMLVSPRYARWSILAISLEAGFADLSHFNRRFKRRFLMTPREMRASRLA